MLENIFSLDKKIALITGGNGGLGLAVAEIFREAGASVIICGRKVESSQDFYAIKCDITNQDSINSLFTEIANKFNRLDILVNCAGKNILKPAEDYDSDSFLDVMNLNINALHNVTREAGKRFMIPQRSGKILNLSSVKSIIGTDKDYIAYCTSKGALNMYTKQLACEWGKYNINVNAIAPTFVRTPINSFQLDNKIFYESLINRIPLGRIGQKKDIAAAALFLCSEAADFITGQILCVDGGLTARQ
ncbi:MAG: SDR family oxidoreductase [Synergistaceae bacterium]|nr:SDR family oxidoreductase [Synergistaceae bacterium]